MRLWNKSRLESLELGIGHLALLPDFLLRLGLQIASTQRNATCKVQELGDVQTPFFGIHNTTVTLIKLGNTSQQND